MNRIKKEIRKREMKLESDYPFLPYYVKGKSCFDVGNICVEGVTVDSENATVTRCLNILVEKYKLLRNGKLVMEGDE